MPRLAGGLLMFGCAAAALPAAAQSAPVDPLVLTHANVVDVRTGRVTADATLVLRGGRIESIGGTPAPSSVRTLDLKGKYVLPGLIDAHTHADNFAAFQRALESGVTTMRSAGVSFAQPGPSSVPLSTGRSFRNSISTYPGPWLSPMQPK